MRQRGGGIRGRVDPASERSRTESRAFADIGAEGVRSFVADLRQGVGLTDALANGLGRLGDRLMDLGLDLALSPLLNALSGGLTSALGFSGGGAVSKFAEWRACARPRHWHVGQHPGDALEWRVAS